ncbi:hypothetical protein DFS33DRAFT_347732 [Desarmillaria ectypa]|nr:hypothetical protein DFS33DRAFT_347732 [Desarmillaria ectypa]
MRTKRAQSFQTTSQKLTRKRAKLSWPRSRGSPANLKRTTYSCQSRILIQCSRASQKYPARRICGTNMTFFESTFPLIIPSPSDLLSESSGRVCALADSMSNIDCLDLRVCLSLPRGDYQIPRYGETLFQVLSEGLPVVRVKDQALRILDGQQDAPDIDIPDDASEIDSHTCKTFITKIPGSDNPEDDIFVAVLRIDHIERLGDIWPVAATRRHRSLSRVNNHLQLS